MTLYLNNETNNPIIINNYTRDFNVSNSNFIYRIDINFNNDYDLEAINQLRKYIKTPINSIKIINNNNQIILNAINIHAEFLVLTETGNDDILSACCAFIIYEEEN